MNFISRLKIGARLGAAFAAVLALALLQGLISVRSLATINDATTEVTTNWLVGTRALGDYRSAISTIRRAEAGHVMSAKTEDLDTEERRMAENKAKAAEAWRLYTATVGTGEERALAQEIETAQQGYYDALARLLPVSRAGGADIEKAKEMYRTVTQPAYNNVLAATSKDVEFQVKGADRAFEESQATYVQTRHLVVGLLVANLAIGALLAWLITRSITQPIAMAVRVAETVAGGDLTSEVRVDGADETGQLLAALKKMNDGLVGIVGQVRNSSDSIATGSAQIATGNADLSQRTEEQAGNLQQTAASMEQLTATVKQNADTARQANQLASSASAAAQQGGEVVGRVVATMDVISQSSKKISDIIGVIDGIAFQTNILALNAAVEAARAGEQGRGFAVVASEVRSLAQRSAQAAKQIKTLIGESVEKVEDGSQLVVEAGRSMDEIVLQVRRVSDLIAEISASSAEQSTGIGQIGDAVFQLDQVTQQNAALVEESAAAAESLRHQAARLAHVVSVFKLSQAPLSAVARVALPPAPRSANHRASPAKAEAPAVEWESF